MPLEPSPLQRQYWLSGDHVGTTRTIGAVRIRKGRFNRAYSSWPGKPLNAVIPGSKRKFWQANWTPLSPWMWLPGLFSVEITQGFDDNGLMVATVVIENIWYEQMTGQTGLVLHVPRLGYFSPLRGFHTGVRPPLAGTANEWYGMFGRKAQIDIQSSYGFGDAFRVMTGLIDDCEITDKPYRITLTVRDFGQTLTDQRFFGTVKDPNLRDPIVFAPQHGTNGADERIKEGTSARASGSEPGFPPRLVLDKDTKTFWASGPKLSPNNTEWVEIRVPEGRYEAFYLHPAYENMECWVSFYAKPLQEPKADAKQGVDEHPAVPFDPRPLVNGVRQTNLGPSGGWIDLHPGELVPGSDGGIPFTKHFASLDEKGGTHRLGAEIRCGDNSIIRVHFRNLHKSRIRFGDYPGQQLYRGGVRSLYGWRLHRKEQAKAEKWILVNDLADIVRVILRWAGFKEWEVEDTGINLKGRYIVNRSKYLVDVINEIKDKVGYVFFMSAPSDWDLSIGIPVFRRSHVYQLPPFMEELSGDQILTGLRVKFTDQPLSSIIYVRGKAHQKKTKAKDTLGGGQSVGSHSDRRVQASYRPPWARWGHDAGIIKHVVQVYPDLETYGECYMACLLIALAELTAAQTASCEIPVWPGINLDDLVGLRDEAAGITSRLWIAQRTLTYQFGQQGGFSETLQGTLLDSPAMQQMYGDYVTFVNDVLAKEKSAKDRGIGKVKVPKAKAPPVRQKTTGGSHPSHPQHPTTSHPLSSH